MPNRLAAMVMAVMPRKPETPRRSVLEIEHCADDVRNVTHPSEGMNFASASLSSFACIGVFTFPGDTVFTRIPLAAYSNAKALLTAGMVDFESTARRAGTLPLGWSARTAEMYYVSRILLLHLRDHLLRHEEVAGHIGVHYQIVVVLGVLGERLGNENACFVNQQVDTAEMLDCCLRYFDGGFLLADVTVDEDEID
jgi:hypothetical protein